MFKTINTIYEERLIKGGVGSGVYEHKRTKETEVAKPAKRRLSQQEAFKYYVKIKDGKFGYNIVAKVLNRKVGMAEGQAKAYRERAGKMSDSPEKEKLLKVAYRLQVQAAEYASARDSQLGRPAWRGKMLKQDYSEQDITDMIDSGEFDESMWQEIEQDLGEKIER